MADLREVVPLQAEIEGAGQRGITKDQILEIIQSISTVQADMTISNGSVDFTFVGSAWGPIFDEWEDNTDTQGVQEGPTPGTPPYEHYLIKPNGGGIWAMSGRLKGTCDTAGTVWVRPVIVRTDLTLDSFGHIDKSTILAGGEFDLSFTGATTRVLLEGEKMALQFRGPNGGIATIVTGHLVVKRG